MKPDWIPQAWEVPEHLLIGVGRTVGRQRAICAEEHILLILHAPPKPGDDCREARVFWCDEARKWWPSVEALRAHLEAFHDQLEELESANDRADSADDFFSGLDAAQPLHRTCRNLHQTLVRATELDPDLSELVNLRDKAYALSRQSELLTGEIKNGLDLYVARQTEQMTRSSHQLSVAGHRLNLLAAVFLPTATLAALLGMNLPSGLESMAPPWPFYCTILAGMLMGFGLKMWLEAPTESGDMS